MLYFGFLRQPLCKVRGYYWRPICSESHLFSRHLIYSFFLFLHSLAASLFFMSLTSLFLAASSAWLPEDPFVLLCTVTSCWSEEPAGMKTDPVVPPLVGAEENWAEDTVCEGAGRVEAVLTPPIKLMGVTIW